MKRVLNYGLPVLNVALLAVLLGMLRGVTEPKAVIDLGFPILNFAILVGLLVASRGWTGPSQDMRLRRVEGLVERHEQRLDATEHNVTVLFRDLTQSLHSLSKEVHVIAQALPRLALVETRETALEGQTAEMEQRLAFLGDLGCGFPGCPRYAVAHREKSEPPGGPKETKEE